MCLGLLYIYHYCVIKEQRSPSLFITQQLYNAAMWTHL